MKKKENIRKHEVGRPKSVARKGQCAEGKEPEVSSKQQGAGSLKQVTRKNSTVFHNKRLSPVIIDFSREELAIRACDLLRIFNN
jgi:hypothetical protein